MATRKTTPKKSTWKSAASDLVDAAQSLGKAVASKAEDAKADATTALARAKKSVTEEQPAGRQEDQRLGARRPSAASRRPPPTRRSR